MMAERHGRDNQTRKDEYFYIDNLSSVESWFRLSDPFPTTQFYRSADISPRTGTSFFLCSIDGDLRALILLEYMSKTAVLLSLERHAKTPKMIPTAPGRNATSQVSAVSKRRNPRRRIQGYHGVTRYLHKERAL